MGESMTWVEPDKLIATLQAWYDKNRGKRFPWGRATQENMAHKMGVAYPTVSLWLRNKQPAESLRDDSLKKIRAFLKLVKADIK